MGEETDASATSLSLLDDCLTGLYTSHVSSRASRRERRASSRGSSRAAAAAPLPAAAGAAPDLGGSRSSPLFPEPRPAAPEEPRGPGRPAAEPEPAGARAPPGKARAPPAEPNLVEPAGTSGDARPPKAADAERRRLASFRAKHNIPAPEPRRPRKTPPPTSLPGLARETPRPPQPVASATAARRVLDDDRARAPRVSFAEPEEPARSGLFEKRDGLFEARDGRSAGAAPDEAPAVELRDWKQSRPKPAPKPNGPPKAADPLSAKVADIETKFEIAVADWQRDNAAATPAMRERFADHLTDRFLCAQLDPLPSSDTVRAVRRRVAAKIELVSSGIKPPPPKGPAKDWVCAACSKANPPDARVCGVCRKRAPSGDEPAPEPLVKSVAKMKRHTDAKASEIQGLTDDIQGFLQDLKSKNAGL